MSGTLTFDQSVGVRLDLVGAITPMGHWMGAGPEQITVHGFTNTGKPVTLLKAIVTNTRIGMPGLTTQTISRGILAVGAHFTSGDEVLFRRSWTRFDGIARWLGHDPFVESYDFATVAVDVAVRKPPRLELGTIPGATVYSGVSITSGRQGDEQWTATSESMIAIDATDAQNLDWHFAASAKLRDLAALLFGRALQFTKFSLELPVEAQPGERPHVDVDIYAQMIGGDETLAPVDRPPMLTAPALLAANAAALTDWFTQYETLSAALHLLTTVADDRRMFINVRFLLAAQAVETFHRDACPGTIMPMVEHGALISTMLGAMPGTTPNAMREKLKGTLGYSNEPSLRQRLRALIVAARDGRGGALPTYGKPFIDAVVATRNYETHHDKRPANLLRGIDLHWAIRRIVVLLTALFLRRLKLTPQDIDVMISQHREFRTLWTSTEAA